MKNARRGEVWLVDFGYTAKTRPAVIVSTSYRDDERALVACVPHTTSTRGGRFELVIPAGYLESGAFDVQGLGHAKPTNLLYRLGVLNAGDLHRIEVTIKQWLELK